MTDRQEFVWAEKYRPRKIEDCILPASMKKIFKGFLRKGEINSMMLAGSPGTGKTTLAKALCEELGCDYILINASKESGIDTLRTKIQSFCSTVSLSGGPKVVILDEFDRASPAFQDAFRTFVEDFISNARFILTCNQKNRIIEPIHSRCPPIEFSIEKAERPKMAQAFMERLKKILDAEGVTYNEKVVAQLLLKHFPDYRRVINELQRYSVDGDIDEGLLAKVQNVDIKALFDSLKGKDFKAMRKWVADNSDSDPNSIFRQIYDHASDYIEPTTIPNAILLLADYQYKAAFARDQEINLAACLTELMATLKYK